MTRNKRYDILFEPVKIGPVTAPNRFYQVPHDLGTGNHMPHIHAGMREVRAEGGWGVVNTGYCSIHPSADESPFPFCHLWDDEDTKSLSLVANAVHKHGSLAGIELWWHSGSASNRMTRMSPMSASGICYNTTIPNWISLIKSRPMDKSEIREFRRWYVDAALRAKSAGFDIIYIYCGMGFGPSQFLQAKLNKRNDEYGGSFENRIRLMREVIEDVKEAVGDTCAVAVRYSTDDMLKVPSENYPSEAHEVIATLSDLPDLWDIKSADWNREVATARFYDSGHQEPWNGFVKGLTDKPVVGVGRFTSPDEMVSQIKRGVLDLIGAARPSIADPFLPNKIDEGKEDEIRECIGCNICVSAYHDGVPVRCTQNPTMGEEWRRNWHPEKIPAGNPDKSALVVGAGPAGLECALALGQRGFSVTLAEATSELGGRVSREATLPGLSSWARVRDYRVGHLQTMVNVDIYRESPLTTEDILEYGCDHVVIATGANWSRELLGSDTYPAEEISGDNIFTPDDILAGTIPDGPVVIYDFDYYYMGSCIAELLKEKGCEVTIVTPASAVSAWTVMNNEAEEIRQRMNELEINLIFENRVTAYEDGSAQLENVFKDGGTSSFDCASLVIVGSKTANDGLYQNLKAKSEQLADSGISSLHCIGDCGAPGIIAHAVYSGHECARNIDSDDPIGTYRMEKPSLNVTS